MPPTAYNGMNLKENIDAERYKKLLGIALLFGMPLSYGMQLTNDNKIVKFILTKDNRQTEERTIEKRYVLPSVTIKNMFEDMGATGAETPIPLETTPELFDRLIPALKIIADTPQESIPQALLTYLQQLNLDDQKLGALVNLANYLDLQPIIDAGLKIIEERLTSKDELAKFVKDEDPLTYNPFNLSSDVQKIIASKILKTYVKNIVIKNLKGPLQLQRYIQLESDPKEFHRIDNPLLFIPGGNDPISFLPKDTVINKNPHIWKFNNGQWASQEIDNKSAYQVDHIALSNDGIYLASVGGPNTNKEINIWKFERGQLIHQQTMQVSGTGPIGSLVFSPDSHYLVLGGAGLSITILKFDNGQCTLQQTITKSMEGNEKNAQSLVFSPDGKYLISGSNGIKIWKFNNGQCTALETIGSITSIDNHISSMVFSPDGKYLVVGWTYLSAFSPYYGGSIKFYTFENGQCILEEDIIQPSPMSSLAFSRDGKYLASGAWNGTIMIYNLQNGRLLLKRIIDQSVGGHTSPISSITFNGDGSYLGTTSKDDEIKIWNLYPPEARQFVDDGTLQQALLLLYAEQNGPLILEANNPLYTIYNQFKNKKFISPLISSKGLWATLKWLQDKFYEKE